MAFHEPLEAEPVADLFVGRGDEDEIAGAAPAFARQGRDGDGARHDLALHVEGAAAPDVPVDELAAERIALPFRRLGEHDIGMGEHRE